MDPAITRILASEMDIQSGIALRNMIKRIATRLHGEVNRQKTCSGNAVAALIPDQHDNDGANGKNGCACKVYRSQIKMHQASP